MSGPFKLKKNPFPPGKPMHGIWERHKKSEKYDIKQKALVELWKKFKKKEDL